MKKRAGEPKRIPRNPSIYIILLVCSMFFLVIEHMTHFEFLLHLAAIPLEILAAVFIVERYLEKKDSREKRRQLMYIKSYMFRSEMRNLFITNFEALESPQITMSIIKNSNLEELKAMRQEAENFKYKSLEAMELIIMEYVKAESVWHSFKERAITYNFEEIFEDMIYILHFVYDVKSFKSRNQDKLFIYEASKREVLMNKVRRILGDGIKKFLDYALELKEKNPELFSVVLSDYEASAQLRNL